jgi:hypothetical protein
VTHLIRAILLDLGVVLVACTIAGCGMIPLTMPAADEVDRIFVSSRDGSVVEAWDKPPLVRTIDNRDQIAQIVAFLAAHRRGWYQLWDSPPNSICAVNFERDQQVVFSFDLQRDSMGSYSGNGGYKLRRIDAQESKRIHELLGITASEE